MTNTNFNFKGFNFPKTDAEKVRANVEAVALVKELEKTQQQATVEQQEILAKYVGWGGLANVFFDRYTGKFEEERSRLESLVTPEEYQAMERSSLTAYYTDPRIVEQMWDYLFKNGFKGGNILDPSMGTGIFFGTMPKEIQEKSTLVGVELDTISGQIAKQLFPEATILIQGFETVEFDGKPFDLIMTNVPFSEFRIADMNYDKPYVIHDYFLRKSVDLLHENGVIGFVTSMGTANKRSNSILKEIKDEVAFLGGVRLPSSAFKELAGTTVSSDILFFEKDRLKTKSSNDIFFKEVIRSSLDEEGRIFINPYFYFEENQVLGKYDVRHFNGATLSVKPNKDSDLFLDIKEGLSTIYAPTFAGYSLAEVTITSKEQFQSSVRPYEYGFD
ncbi:MAG: N-6 DNA methylase, partial [Streptococcus salivarius]|nr:N-6 DNA methylase [Streptococcus salivarius]